MEKPPPSHASLLGSLRGLASGLIGTAHDRLELLAIELHEEKHRLIQVFIWISSIVFLAMVAVVFASLAIVVLWWESARVAVVCTLACVYTGALIAAVLGFKRYLKRQPKPFAATLGELRDDRECFRVQN